MDMVIHDTHVIDHFKREWQGTAQHFMTWGDCEIASGSKTCHICAVEWQRYWPDFLFAKEIDV